jgi:hypothetical protein
VTVVRSERAVATSPRARRILLALRIESVACACMRVRGTVETERCNAHLCRRASGSRYLGLHGPQDLRVLLESRDRAVELVHSRSHTRGSGKEEVSRSCDEHRTPTHTASLVPVPTPPTCTIVTLHSRDVSGADFRDAARSRVLSGHPIYSYHPLACGVTSLHSLFVTRAGPTRHMHLLGLV